MQTQQESFQKINPGETVSVENTQESELPVSFTTADGVRLNIDLAPGRIIRFSAGSSAAKIGLNEGNPKDLLIIKPETP